MIKAVIFDLNGIFTEKHIWEYATGRKKLSEPMLRFAGELRTKGIKVFILSNSLRELVLHHARYDLVRASFDKVYYPWQTGFLKPDARAWHHVLKDNSLEPEECLFFDDKPENVAAAQKIGIASHLFTNEDELERIINKQIKTT